MLKKIFIGAPLLIIPVIVYAFLNNPETLSTQLISSSPFPSGDVWDLNVGDMLIALSLICLCLEFMASTDINGAGMLNTPLSFGVLVVCLYLMFFEAGFGHSVFILITTMVLVDVIAGPYIAMQVAKFDKGSK